MNEAGRVFRVLVASMIMLHVRVETFLKFWVCKLIRRVLFCLTLEKKKMVGAYLYDSLCFNVFKLE